MSQLYESWGRYPKPTGQHTVTMPWRYDELPAGKSILPFGLGKSYGDACLNDNGLLLSTRNLNHFISFDKHTGRLACEAGVTLAEILQLIIPHGWFLPVTPGTKFITLGGAISNDIHGKNHHRAGTFGHHVIKFELLRSDGSRTICSPTEHADLFQATIGGIGLTGLITWVEIELTKISAPFINSETVVLKNLADFFTTSQKADSTFDYTVAWIDTNGRGKHLGRGLFMQGNFTKETSFTAPDIYHAPRLSIPGVLPFGLINTATSKAFNWLYWNVKSHGPKKQTVHYDPFFFPLDSVAHWNRLYGPRGFLQYQCVIPLPQAESALTEILERLQVANFSSPLTVLKMFGSKPALGHLSFPRSGSTLTLDLPNRPDVFPLLETFDKTVLEAGGAIYLAKDARMSPAMFQHSYPKWQEFKKHIDPNFSSSLWRRVSFNG